MNEFHGYDPAHEEFMRVYHRSLPEDHRRRYAAIEALKIGFGGITYVARVLGMSRRTIYTGIDELEAMRAGDPEHPQRPSGEAQRIRRPGGGRAKVEQRQAGLEETLEAILDAHSAGSPTDARVRWTDLKPMQLSQELLRRGYQIARNTAAKLLDRAGYRRRSLRKELATGRVDPHERDRQFRNIDALRRHAHEQGNPVLCIDTKKKEPLGNLYRPGQCYSSDEQEVYDHDYRHLATGVLVPHGVYDYFNNAGFITLGTSHDTGAFICDAIALAWEEDRKACYPEAKEILLTFDAGGGNSIRSTRFKEDLMGLSERLGLPLRVAHYPPYTSKWNPIEHRLFSQVERSWRGIILDSPETALETVQRTQTQTGLTVKARILDTVYELGRKCSNRFKEIKDEFIRHDAVLGKWNYVVDASGAL